MSISKSKDAISFRINPEDLREWYKPSPFSRNRTEWTEKKSIDDRSGRYAWEPSPDDKYTTSRCRVMASYYKSAVFYSTDCFQVRTNKEIQIVLWAAFRYIIVNQHGGCKTLIKPVWIWLAQSNRRLVFVPGRTRSLLFLQRGIIYARISTMVSVYIIRILLCFCDFFWVALFGNEPGHFLWIICRGEIYRLRIIRSDSCFCPVLLDCRADGLSNERPYRVFGLETGKKITWKVSEDGIDH